ncbi:Hypothetical predicted protein [Xyrichtys novacula]|uniref:Uncharacterized protein n=1 Tax=Xyrichtys novacula TaxID=13765 RepID=A0AAV1F9H5_XYRNO|nr:Hypothetical predicted protein [Xyrichtys novacula]
MLRGFWMTVYGGVLKSNHFHTARGTLCKVEIKDFVRVSASIRQIFLMSCTVCPPPTPTSTIFPSLLSTPPHHFYFMSLDAKKRFYIQTPRSGRLYDAPG